MSVEKKWERISQDPKFERKETLSTDIEISEDQKEFFIKKLEEYKKREKDQLTRSGEFGHRDIRETIYMRRILELLIEDKKVNIFELERILGREGNFSTRIFNEVWEMIQNYVKYEG